MSKFKVGDKVRLVDTSTAERYGISKPEENFPSTATVEEVGKATGWNSWEFVRLVEDDVCLAWPEDALELVEEKKEEIMKTFNIGDKVRVNSKKTNANFYAQGAEGIVTNANPEDFEVQFYKGSYDPDLAGVWYVNPEHVDLIEEPVEDAAVQNLFKVGQTVWCLIFGKGVVRKVFNREPYPVEVVFDNGHIHVYSEEGHFAEDSNRTLFFSDPKIEAAKQPLFSPTLKDGDMIVIQYNGLNSIQKVKQEQEDRIEVYSIDMYDSIWFRKNEKGYQFWKLGEEVKF